jgi:hypothetical protein
MNDTTQTLIRSVLKVGGGFLASKGIADDSQVELVSAGLIALIAVIWGYFHRSKPAAE